MATILVTGGAGYIGAHTAKALAAAGHLPVVYDNLSCGHRYAVQWGPFELGDIGDAARLDAVLDAHRPQAVLHFAASSEVGQSVREPLTFWRNNVAGSLTLLERTLDHGIKSFVFSSTCAIYGIPPRVPLHESLDKAPINPYGATKLAIERMLQDASDAHGINVVALRYFNAAGASIDGEIGEDHRPETHVVPLVLMAAQDPSRIFGVFGDDYPTPDGSCIRDYIHVEDLAAAHVSAVNRILAGELSGFRGLNLGTGTGLSVLEIIDAARRITGADIRVAHKEKRPGDPPSLVADPSAAMATLDWSPTRSDLSCILSTAWDWEQRPRRAS